MASSVLLEKLIPLYLIVAAGILASRRLKLSAETVGSILIYVISPVVIFFTVLAMPLSPSRLTLPLLFYVICASIGLAAREVASRRLDRASAGILAFACGSGNSGYFGLPLTLAILGPEYLGLAILCALGFSLYENSLGFFFAARGRFSARQSLRALSRLPTVYCALSAILLNLYGARVPDNLLPVADQFRGAYTVLGMFLIGMSAGMGRSWKIDWRFASIGLGFKFVVWPVVVAACLGLNAMLGFYDGQAARVLPLMAVVPLPAVSAAVATIFDLRPHDVALMVLLSTLLALGVIPVVLGLFSLVA